VTAERHSQQSSCYVNVGGGAQLACHIVLPQLAQDEEKWPTLICFDRYHLRGNFALDYRAIRYDDVGNPILPITTADPSDFVALSSIRQLIAAGFAVVFVDCRGSGASIGTSSGLFSECERSDAKEILRWVAAQPWCDGRLGMFGRSYRGALQYLAATGGEAALKAICPEMAPFDLFDSIWHGGIFWGAALDKWCKIVAALGAEGSIVSVPEGAPNGALQEDRMQRYKLRQLVHDLRSLPFRDSAHPSTGDSAYMAWSPQRALEQINQTDVACLQIAGWYDLWVLDQLLWFANLKVPQALIIGPWCHCGGQAESEVIAAKWMELCMDDRTRPTATFKKLLYFVVNGDRGKSWRVSETWPPKESRSQDFFFGSSSTARPALSERKPGMSEAFDTLIADLSTTSGSNSRWANLNATDFGYSDRTNAGGLAYTSEPLSNPMEVTGHPILHIWLQSAEPDLAIFVYLEAVSRSGFSQYVTEGALRLTYRHTHQPPYDRLDLPWHRSHQCDISSLPAEPFLVQVDLLPISYQFRTGERIRVRLTCADADNADPVSRAGATVKIFRDSIRSSRMALPTSPIRPDAEVVDPLHALLKG
jgi:uncharacterized protein